MAWNANKSAQILFGNADWPTVASAASFNTRMLVRLQSEASKPRVLLVRVTGDGGAANRFDFDRTAMGSRLAIGNSSVTIANQSASDGRSWLAGLRLSYGSGAFRRVAIFDCMSGQFQIPPCEFVEASVVLWRPFLGAGTFSMAVEATIEDGLTTTPTRATNTCFFSLAAAAQETIRLQGGARWLDLADVGIPNAIGAAAAPVLKAFSNLTNRGPQIQRDYVNRTWFPSGDPCEIYPELGSLDLFVRNDGTANSDSVMVRQFLEL